MYTSHFGLTEAPFAITPDPRYLYLSPQHREGLAHLLFGIRQPGGFVQLTGEVGTGKTILCRCLLEQLPPEVDVAFILSPQVTALELLASICDELRISYPPGTRSLKELVDLLYHHLLDAHARGRRTVLILDEAQNLSTGVLEQIRLLTNLETTTEKLLQIILIGQPELLRLLRQPQLRQLAQRITARCHLRPFRRRDTCNYIRHRLEVAGGIDGIFTRWAMRRVHRISRGIPRVINVLCDRALLGGYARGEMRVSGRIVGRAARELRGAGGSKVRLARPAWVTVLGALLAAGTIASVLVAGGRLPILRPSGERAHPARVEALPAPPAAPSSVQEPRVQAQPVSGQTAVPAPRLAGVLAQAGAGGDDQAFASVYARWGLKYRAGAGCGASAPGGLECAARRGNWTRLRRFDLPALLEVTTPDGARRRLALVALGDQEATLALGDEEHRVSLADIDAAWDGSFILLWRPPPLRSRVLAPGARGEDVRWLRQTFNEMDGLQDATPPSELYDEALTQRVLAFQRAQQLTADGIVGDETLLQLVLARPGSDVPHLSPQGAVKGQ